MVSPLPLLEDHMRVRAIKKCFFDLTRRRAGEEFMVPEGTELPDFIESIEPPPKPPKKRKAKAEAQKKPLPPTK